VRGPAAYFLSGPAYESTGDLSGAKKAYNKALELEPEWTNPYRVMSGICSGTGEVSDAMARAE